MSIHLCCYFMRLLIVCWFVLFAGSLTAFGQAERFNIKYDASGGGCSPTTPPFIPGITFSDLQRGSSVFCTGSGSGFNTNSYHENSYNQAVNENDYIYFTLNADPTACTVSFDSVLVSLRKSGTGPREARFAYRKNNGPLIPFGSVLLLGGSGVNTTNHIVSPPSPITLAANEIIEVRLYAWDATTNAGTMRIVSDNFVNFRGSVVLPVETPIFVNAPASVCQGDNFSVQATATYATAISYAFIGNAGSSTIDAGTGAITLDPAYTGNITVEATATGTVSCGQLTQSATTTIIIDNSSSETIDTTVCEQLLTSFMYRGQTFTKDGTYTLASSSPAGCDSVFILNLTVAPNSITNLDESICEGENYTFAGQTFGVSGIYSDTIINIGGC